MTITNQRSSEVWLCLTLLCTLTLATITGCDDGGSGQAENAGGNAGQTNVIPSANTSGAAGVTVATDKGGQSNGDGSTVAREGGAAGSNGHSAIGEGGVGALGGTGPDGGPRTSVGGGETGAAGAAGAAGAHHGGDCGNGRVDAHESCDGTAYCTADCQCADGYHAVAQSCVVDEKCGEGRCSSHAICQDATGVVVCSCIEPWTGTHCAECIAGYHLSSGGEPTCELDESCTETTCNGHGICSATAGTTSCVCDTAAGYTGSNCRECLDGWTVADDGTCVHVNYCSGMDCLEGGGCSSDWETKSCECNPGYIGDACDTCASGHFDSAGQDFPNCIPDPCVAVAAGACGWGKCVPNTGGASYTCACTDPHAVAVNNVCVCQPGYVDGASGCVTACPGLHQVWSTTAEQCVCAAAYVDPDPTDPVLSCTACAPGYVDTNHDGVCSSTACGYPLESFCGGTESCHYKCEPYPCRAIYVDYTCVNGTTLMTCKWGKKDGLMGFYWQTVSGVSCAIQ